MRSKFGIDISSHRSRYVKDLIIDDFDCMVAMDSTVVESLRRTYPVLCSKLITWDIIDPIGQGVKVYERCAKDESDVVCSKPPVP